MVMAGTYIIAYKPVDAGTSLTALSDLSGQIATQYNQLIQNGGVVWTIRYTFYITFKNPK
jgi:hypothetical protein